MRSACFVASMTAGLWLMIASACSEETAEGACDAPGSSQKCDCPDGRKSVQTCSAYGQWGACYCYRPGCGNGELDDAEDCDDGNAADGDGCSAMCTIETGGPGGAGPTTSSTGGMGGNPTTGGGGVGGSGGAGGVGGAGGIGVGGIAVGGIGGA